ncbi:MAG: photosynthetic complex putative assembly protein PuhB [Pseudomonadota bacterium]
MALFHDEEDGNPEPVPGLPEALPAGERILWQGKPNGFILTIHALHIRFIALYFALFTLWRLAAIAARDGTASEMASVAGASLAGFIVSTGLLMTLGWTMARATIFTITNKRVVMRYGAAIRKYVNIPFKIIEAAALKSHGQKAGSIALSTSDDVRIGYLHLWPHARPWRYSTPEPMLRALPNADDIAQILCRAIKAQAPSSVKVTLGDETNPTPPHIAGDAVAAA